VFYTVDNDTSKQESLKTRDRKQALALLQAKNEAFEQPALSFQKARIYLIESDPGHATRTWQHIMVEMAKTKRGETLKRWERVVKDPAFDSIRELVLIETKAEHFINVLEEGTVSTNVFLRRIHNFALDLAWIPKAIIPKRHWPKIHFKEKRAITPEEHWRIVLRETNAERRAFYQLCWLFLSGSTSDTHAGDGTWLWNPTQFRVSECRAVTMDFEGNLLICEHDSGYIRKVQFLRQGP